MSKTESRFSFQALLDKLDNVPHPVYRVGRIANAQGRAWINMVMPGDEASQRRTARIVLGYLP